jgi:small-conductance mechanosensitive channel
MSPLDRIQLALEHYLGVPQALTARLAGTLLVIVVYVFVSRVTKRIVTRTVDHPDARFSLQKTTSYVYGVVAFLALAKIWFQGVTGFATYLGLLSAGIAIALQDLIASLAGWIFILVRRPFRVGDRIQIGQHMGDVVDIRPFRFILLEVGNWVHADQSTGRVIHVPNALVLKQPVSNFDEAFGYIWNEIEVVVTFESNWRRAKEVLDGVLQAEADKLTEEVVGEITEAAEGSFHVKLGKLTPVVWTSVVDHGVRLTMRYLCKARERRSSSSQLWEKVLEGLGERPDVELAYPTVRRFDNVREGKPGARASA